MKAKYKKVILLYASIFLGVFFSSCDKNETKTPIVGNEETEVEVQSVPFFEVEKGDSISKGVFRDKPLFEEKIEILFSTEDTRKKAKGESDGNGYIYELKVSVRSGNNAPETMSEGGRTYYKIPVDLNEGAGGKWIYLYYTKSTDKINAKGGFNFQTHSWVNISLLQPHSGWHVTGRTFANGGWADLNDGAGGYYIGLEAMYARETKYVITDIAIISSTNSMNSYDGWSLVPTDMNKGAGGKWIYLCYKTEPY